VLPRFCPLSLGVFITPLRWLPRRRLQGKNSGLLCVPVQAVAKCRGLIAPAIALHSVSKGGARRRSARIVCPVRFCTPCGEWQLLQAARECRHLATGFPQTLSYLSRADVFGSPPTPR